MLRLGVIGMSEGNGHPYSWSAIFNGYDPKEMAACPFPAIPAYLEKQTFPGDAIAGAHVTHVWTQSPEVSAHLARAAHIPHIVDDYQDLIGQVDAILLARDDAESHLEMATPFLEAGVPIYIDKPVAYDLATLKALYAQQRYEGQLFTCSALAYAQEFQLTEEERTSLGSVRHVEATVMKGWGKYGVHVIEPVLKLIGDQGALVRVQVAKQKDKHFVWAAWSSGLTASFAALGDTVTPIAIHLYGTTGSRRMEFLDTFSAFRAALQTFIRGIEIRSGTPYADSARVVELIERGYHGE